MVKKILVYWRDIPSQVIVQREAARLDSEFSDEHLMQLIRMHGSVAGR